MSVSTALHDEAHVANSKPPAPNNQAFMHTAETLHVPIRLERAGSRMSSKGSSASIQPRPSFAAYEEEIGIVDPDTPAEEIPTNWATALDIFGCACMIGLAYVAFLFLFEVDYLLPYDSGFAVAVLWTGSMVGREILKIVGLPPLMGMLISGMIIKNCGDLARGLPDEWGMGIRAFGLMNILMRGGLEMDFDAVKRVGWAVVRLTIFPGVTEAFTTAGLACIIFGMPFFLALSMGFILGAVSPAVVVGGMFMLQQRGYGVDQGIPSLVVAAASFDDVVAISGFSMFIGLAVGKGDVLMSALHGPLEVVAGVGFGMIGGLILSCTRLWETIWKRTGLLLLLGIAFTFSAKQAHFSGAGALASLVSAGAAGQFWTKGFGGPFFSLGPEEHFVHEVEHLLCILWKHGSEPLLFGVIGNSLDFSKVEGPTVPKALAVIIGGVLMRSAMAYFATMGAGLTFKERLFIALAWMPKATVQAALGSVPLDMIRENLDKAEDPDKYEKMEQHGLDILTVAVLSILVTAPGGLIVIQQLGPRWLQKEGEGEVDDFNLEDTEAAPEAELSFDKKANGVCASQDSLEDSGAIPGVPTELN